MSTAAGANTDEASPAVVDDAVMNQALLSTPLHRQMALTLVRTESGVTLGGTFGPDMARADGMNVAHGGAIASALDTATVWAAVAATSRLWATADLRVDYLRPAALGDITVTGSVLQAGSAVARTRAELRDSLDRLAAVATATLIAQPGPTA